MLFEHSEAVGKTKLHLQILIETCRCVLVYGGKAKRIHVVSPALYFGSKLVWFSSNNRNCKSSFFLQVLTFIPAGTGKLNGSPMVNSEQFL